MTLHREIRLEDEICPDLTRLLAAPKWVVAKLMTYVVEFPPARFDVALFGVLPGVWLGVWPGV